MDRKGIIAVTLAFVTLVFWYIENTKEMARLNAAKQEAAAMEAAEKAAKPAAPDQPAAAAAAAAAGAPAAPGAPAVPAAPVVPAVPEQIEKVPTPDVEYAFTNLGGGITRVTLLKHAVREHPGDPDRFVELNTFGDAPIGAVTETPGEGDAAALAVYSVKRTETGEVICERTDAARQLQIVKKFTLPKAGTEREYQADLDLTFTNLGSQQISSPGFYVCAGSAAPMHKGDRPDYTGFGWYHDKSFGFKDSTSFMTRGAMGFLPFGRTDAPVFEEKFEKTDWTAVTNQYFSTIIQAPNETGAGIWAYRFAVDKSLIDAVQPLVRTPRPVPGPNARVYAVEGALGLPGFTLAPGASVTQHFSIFTGPREYKRLQALGGHEEEIMSFGWVGAVSKVLLFSMIWLKGKLGSYAVAIIVLTLVIRSLMWPLQNKATQSMKKMQLLQPEMNKLKEKYADDPTKMNQELMKLYKVYQINPLAGCLPMFVQLPIFFGFYNMLGKAVELRNATFFWVHDLSQPDTVAAVAGIPVNVLPLMMAGTMLAQMQLSPKSGDPAQQKMMMFMPLIFIYMCYNYASALALYWTATNLFSIVQLYVTRNKTTPVLQKVAKPATKRRA